MRWLDHHVKGAPNRVDLEPRYECAVTPASPVAYNDQHAAWPHRFSPTWPPATPEQHLYLHDNGTLTAAAPTAAEPDQVITHALPAGYTLADFIAEGGGAWAPWITIPAVQEEYVGTPLTAETEIFGRPRLTMAVTVNNFHFQLSATLWARIAGLGDRFLSSGTVGRRLAIPGQHQIEIVMRDAAFVLPPGARLVVKLSNLPLDNPPGQNRMHWVPDLHGSFIANVHISDQLPAELHLPVATRRGVDFTPRLTEASAAAGITLPMAIAAGLGRGNSFYAILFSFSGIAPPVTALGETIWINPDPLTASYVQTGLLDNLGRAGPSFGIAPGIAPPGIRIAMAAIVLDLPGIVASTPIQLAVSN
ncbi:MAG: hypothetical protein KDC98_17645 [Planctomycetes bacterium]|nr:hypothetical protein [Planctomycetota bacterium]